MSDRAYLTDGVTVTDALQARMRGDASLVYVPGKEYGTHHYVFRRTNLPCLVCGEKIRQLRQTLGSFLGADDEGSGGEESEDKTRIVYFCANCQGVDVDAVKVIRKRLG